MTIKTSRPSTSRSVGLPEILEEEVSSAVPGGGNTSSRNPPFSAYIPTEYNQSFRRRAGSTRPRNPVGGWQARNLSNVIPAGPELPPQPSRAGRRPPPEIWLARQAASQIFPRPEPAPPPTAAGNDGARDVNNNIPGTGIAPAPPLVAGSRRRTGRWPWQTRAQTSSIFLGDYVENTPLRPSTSPPRASDPGPSAIHKKWPWQERAQKSVIFELLSGQDTSPKLPRHRIYEWDQRQSRLVTAAVHQDKSSLEQENSSNLPRTQQQNFKSTGESSSTSWPWQERAKQSVIFRSPTKPTCRRPVNFLWDQRKSRFPHHEDPTVQFPKGSSYSDNFVKWQRLHNDKGLKPAGKPCYKDDLATPKHVDNFENQSAGEDILSGAGRGEKRHFREKSLNSGNGDIISHPRALPSPSKSVVKPSASKIKGETCMDIVPVGYCFSEHRPKL